MALHAMELKLIGVLLATMTLFTVTTCQFRFNATSYSVDEHVGYITVDVCLDSDDTESGLGATDSNETSLTVYITSEGESARKL